MARPAVSREQQATGRLIDIEQARLVLRLIERGGMRDASLVKASGIARATLYRLLARLEDLLEVRVEPSDEGLRVASWGGLRKQWVMRNE